MQIEPGDYVVLDDTVGWLAANSRTTRRRGEARFDDEGVLRVDGVNVTKDANGYYLPGVLVISIKRTGD